MMVAIPARNDIRHWPLAERALLSVSASVKIVHPNRGIISSAPRLALMVISTFFRNKIIADRTATSITIDASIDAPAVRELVVFISNAIQTDSRAGVSVPSNDADLIMVRYAAHMLGMEMYVRHFCKTYKDNLRNRGPDPNEFDLMERCRVDDFDDMMTGLGERVAYKRRKGDYPPVTIASLAAYLQVHESLHKAVMDADLRAAQVAATRHN